MRADAERLADALDHAHYALMAQVGLTPDVLSGSREVLHAILFDIIVIGEALHHVSAEVQGLSTDIPWTAVWRTRNFFVHAYWNVDPYVVHEIVERDLPPLIDALGALLRQLKDGRL
jgi:uncharacterized protein with HEPN domain